jgi:hypothetical protein
LAKVKVANGTALALQVKVTRLFSDTSDSMSEVVLICRNTVSGLSIVKKKSTDDNTLMPKELDGTTNLHCLPHCQEFLLVKESNKTLKNSKQRGKIYVQPTCSVTDVERALVAQATKQVKV